MQLRPVYCILSSLAMLGVESWSKVLIRAVDQLKSTLSFCVLRNVKSGRKYFKHCSTQVSLGALYLFCRHHHEISQFAFISWHFTYEKSKNKIKQEKKKKKTNTQAEQLLFYPDNALNESHYDGADSAIENPFTFSSLIPTVNLRLYI